MRYIGGKGKLGTSIAPVIDRALPAYAGRYVEPFVGGNNILYRLHNLSEGALYDLHPGIPALYTAVADGWVPPSELSEKEYKDMRDCRDDSPLHTFVSFACSFGGQEWSSYSKQGTRNLCAEGMRSVMRKVLCANKDKVVYKCSSYLDIHVPSPSVIYCDPPYRGLDLYRGKFDNDVFEAWCEAMSEEHCVLVSEYSAPAHWEVLWQGPEIVSTGTKLCQRERSKDVLYRACASR